jgi:glutathione-regulated potassium-efflux system ancillary protein KefG
MLDAVSHVEGLTLHDLYEVYPDFHIDVAREQQLLTDHDTIVFHHPLYWYSVPALLKQWFDLVLRYNWAFGDKGRALEGKRAVSVVTTGGGKASYGPGTLNRHTIRDFLRPIEQTARLCHMTYLPPFVVQGTHTLTPGQADQLAARYALLLTGLRDGTLQVGAAGEQDYVNDLLANHA